MGFLTCMFMLSWVQDYRCAKATMTQTISPKEAWNQRKQECIERGRTRNNSGSNGSNSGKLQAYAAKGKIKELKWSYKMGMDLTATDYDLRSPLHLAVEEGHHHVVRYLLETCKVPHDQQDRWKKTPLIIATQRKNTQIINYLNNYDKRLREGKISNRQIKDDPIEDIGLTLCEAAAKGDLDTIKIYAERKDVDLKLPDYDGRTALHLACNEGKREVVMLLLKECPDCFKPVDRYGNNPLQDAQKYNQEEIVIILKDHIKSYNAQLKGSQPQTTEDKALLKQELSCRLIEHVQMGNVEGCNEILHQAGIAGITEKVCLSAYQNKRKRTISGGSEVITRANRPLYEIAKATKNDEQIARMFFSKNLKVKPEIASEFMEICIRQEKHDLLVFFLENTRADPNVTGEGGRNPLYTAIEVGNISAVKILLEYGADPNQTQNLIYGHQNPVNFCIRSQVNAQQTTVILEELFRKGANLNAPGYHGLRPIHNAIVTPRPVAQRKELISFLGSKNADLNATDRNDHTILQYAAGDAAYRPRNDMTEEERADLVEFLITQGLPVNHCSKDGNNALHAAAKEDHFLVVKLLLHCNANFTARNIARYTAAEIAPENSGTKKMLQDMLDKNFKISNKFESDNGKQFRYTKRRRKKKINEGRPMRKLKDEPGQIDKGIVSLSGPTEGSSKEPTENEEEEADSQPVHYIVETINSNNYYFATLDNNCSKKWKINDRNKEKIWFEKACSFLQSRLGRSYKHVLRQLYKNSKSQCQIEAMLDNLEEQHRDLDERAIQGLREWQIMKGYSANIRSLQEALSDSKLHFVLSELNDFLWENCNEMEL